MVRREFYERVDDRIRLLSRSFIRHYILKWEQSIDRYWFDVTNCRRRAILWPHVATRVITLIKHRVHIGNNGRALNHVKRRSFPLVGIIQTSARRSRLAAPVRRLSIFVTFPTLESRRATSSGRPRTDRHPSTWRNIDYLSPTMNNRVEFAYYVRDFRRKVRSTDEGIESNANCRRIVRNWK